MMLRATAALCLSFSAIAAATPESGSKSGLREGDRFPDLRLPTLEGGEHQSISSFRGKKVLLLVYASW